MNITKETIKEISKNWKNPISGGFADNKNPSDFPIEQLIKGVKIEQEHTKDLKIALKISMDHLVEFKNYYDYLIDMENKIKKELKENYSMRSIKEYLNETLKKENKDEQIEGYGVKGLNSTKWRRVFKSVEAMNKWAEKNDAEVHGTRKAD